MLKNSKLFATRELRVPGSAAVFLVLIALAFFSSDAFAQSGADIYKMRCSACHAASGAGDTTLGKHLKLRSLRSPEVQQQSDQELITITSRGKNRMPAYDRQLSREQIAAVVRYIRTMKP